MLWSRCKWYSLTGETNFLSSARIKLILESEKSSRFVIGALPWSWFHDKHMPSEISLKWFVEAALFHKADMLLFSMKSISHSPARLPRDHSVPSRATETEGCKYVSSKRVEQERARAVLLRDAQQVFDLICAYELLIMQPTYGQLHIAGGLCKINFCVIIKNQQRQAWSQLYRSYKCHN